MTQAEVIAHCDAMMQRRMVADELRELCDTCGALCVSHYTGSPLARVRRAQYIAWRMLRELPQVTHAHCMHCSYRADTDLAPKFWQRSRTVFRIDIDDTGSVQLLDCRKLH